MSKCKALARIDGHLFSECDGHTPVSIGIGIVIRIAVIVIASLTIICVPRMAILSRHFDAVKSASRALALNPPERKLAC